MRSVAKPLLVQRLFCPVSPLGGPKKASQEKTVLSGFVGATGRGGLKKDSRWHGDYGMSRPEAWSDAVLVLEARRGIMGDKASQTSWVQAWGALSTGIELYLVYRQWEPSASRGHRSELLLERSILG